MKYRKTTGVLGSAVLSCVLACALGAKAQGPVKDIALANAGAVDAKLLQRLQTFAQGELDVPIRTLDVPRVHLKALHEGGQAYVKQMAPNDIFLIVLVAPEADIAMHMALLPDIKVVIVNTKALMTDDAEKYARRIERQVMRSAAFLLGLPSSPDPHDVTRNYLSLDDLDTMGRNFCAPWRVSFEKAAQAAGLQIPPTDSPSRPK